MIMLFTALHKSGMTHGEHRLKALAAKELRSSTWSLVRACPQSLDIRQVAKWSAPHQHCGLACDKMAIDSFVFRKAN